MAANELKLHYRVVFSESKLLHPLLVCGQMYGISDNCW